MSHLEIERKFLVKFPKAWAELAELFDGLVDIKRIWQTYLLPIGDNPAARVRKTIQGLTQDTETIYEFNQKRPAGTAAHQETERKISEKQYQKYLQEPYPGKGEVQKTRFVFEYHDQTFELDVFKGPLQGLAILEIELEDKKQPIELPPFLTIVKEITENKSFNNFELANKTKRHAS